MPTLEELVARNSMLNSPLRRGTSSLMNYGITPQLSRPEGYPTNALDRATLGDVATLGLETIGPTGDAVAIQDATRYAGEGRYGMAALSGASALPGIGGLSAIGMKSVPLAGGIIAGQMAKFHDYPKVTEEILKAIKSPNYAIRNKERLNSGWMTDFTGNHVQREISDADAVLTKDFSQQMKSYHDPATRNFLGANGETQRKFFKLGQAVKHDELYAVYPKVDIPERSLDLQNLTVKVDPDFEGLAAWQPSTSGKGDLAPSAYIVINPKIAHDWAQKFDLKNLTEDDVITSVLLHEVQHVVQYIEDFPHGASPKFFEDLLKPIRLNKIKKDIASAERVLAKNPDSVSAKQTLARLNNEKDFRAKIAHKSGEHMNLYLGTIGERQARDVAERYMKSKLHKYGKYKNDMYSTTPVTNNPNNITTESTSIYDSTFQNPNYVNMQDEGWLNQVGGE